MKTQVINLKHARPGDVYIGRAGKGRPGPWGNPFRLQNPKDDTQRQAVLDRYRRWLTAEVESGRLPLTRLAALAGKRLSCFCKPKDCHGDVLAQAAEWAAGGPDKAAKAAWKA